MPLHVDIRINDALLNTLHIARVKGGTKPDDINDYLIVDGPKPTRHEDWLIDGIPFKHRYGDGAEVCVAKGLKALGHSDGDNAEIIDWIERHRSVIEVEAGINIVRDHFSSDDLIKVIKSGEFNS